MWRLLLLSAIVLPLGSGCMSAYKKSVGANVDQVAMKRYSTDFNEAWQATLDALKSIRLDVSNRDAGFIQTRWVENTAQKNFADGSGTMMPYMSARYRFKVNVAQTLVRDRKIIQVSVQKEQLVQKDALEEFRRQESDLIEENTLLYRIGRIISVKARLARDEKKRIEQEMKSFDPGAAFGPGSDSAPANPVEPAPTPEGDSGELPPTAPEGS